MLPRAATRDAPAGSPAAASRAARAAIGKRTARRPGREASKMSGSTIVSASPPSGEAKAAPRPDPSGVAGAPAAALHDRRRRSSGRLQGGDEARHVVVGRELGGGQQERVAQLGVVALRAGSRRRSRCSASAAWRRAASGMRIATSAKYGALKRRSPRPAPAIAAATWRACVMPTARPPRAAPAGRPR